MKSFKRPSKRAEIPVPGLGYWAKRQHGKKVRRTPFTSDVKDARHCADQPGLSNLLHALNPEVQAKIARESTEVWRIAVPKTLSNLHPILRAWLTGDRNRREGSPTSHEHPHPSRRYAEIERRRLRILSALFGALEKRGHQVVANPQDPHVIAFVIDGERIQFSLTQP